MTDTTTEPTVGARIEQAYRALDELTQAVRLIPLDSLNEDARLRQTAAVADLQHAAAAVARFADDVKDTLDAPAVRTMNEWGKQEPRRENEYTPEELVALAAGNHIWINAFTIIRPKQETLADIGAAVVSALNHSPILDDFIGRTPVAYIRLNAS